MALFLYYVTRLEDVNTHLSGALDEIAVIVVHEQRAMLSGCLTASTETEIYASNKRQMIYNAVE